MAEDQDALFEKILELAMKDKLVLWAGAGLSMEAGYPTGWELTEKLWYRLSEEEKKFVPKELLKVSDHFVNRKKNGRDELILVLKEIFNIEPQKSESHEIIKKVAFFKTILTTNYDELFENYIPGIQVIKNTRDLTRAKPNFRKLIKIHGDLKSPNRIVLTRSDYAKLYERDNRDPFWNLIRVELTQKGVLFIGYGFNDQNVEGLFNYLAKKLKKHNHPKYLVAPGLSGAEQARLGSYEIHYFDSTGEDFFKTLYKVWLAKGYKYFGSEEIQFDDLSKAISGEGILLGIAPYLGKGRKLLFQSEVGKKFDLSFRTKNQEFKRQMTEWRKGLGPDELKITKEATEQSILRIGNLIIGDRSTLPDFTVVRKKLEYYNVRIFFEESGVDLEGLHVKSHTYDDKGLKIALSDANAIFEIIIPKFSKSGYSYNAILRPTEPCNSVLGLLKWQEAIYAFGKGEAFTIITEKYPDGIRQPSGTESKDLQILSRNRLIFQVLRKIEEKFKIRFTNFFEKDIFNDRMLDQLQIFLELFRHQKVPKEFPNGINILSLGKRDEQELIRNVERANKLGGCLIIEDQSEPINLLNKEFNFGKQQQAVQDPVLVKSLNGTNEFVLKSKTNTYFIIFEAFGIMKQVV